MNNWFSSSLTLPLSTHPYMALKLFLFLPKSCSYCQWDHLEVGVWTRSIPCAAGGRCMGKRKMLNILFQRLLSSAAPTHVSRFPFSPANAHTWIWACARSFVITLGISFQKGGGKGGRQGRNCQINHLGVCFVFCFFFLFLGYRWQSTWKSLSYIHYWRFYGLMNVTHLRNRIVFQYSRCSVEHLWLVISHLNISCKHQKLFVCFNVPSHPITQWRWKIEMQRCLAKRFFFPSFLPLLPLLYLCLVSN